MIPMYEKFNHSRYENCDLGLKLRYKECDQNMKILIRV